MFVEVGRFRYRPMGQDEQQSLMLRIGHDVPPIARESLGFRGLNFVRLSDDELMTVWLWDSGDWQTALARFGPLLQEYVVPNLVQPPERVGGEVVLQVTL